MGIVAYENDAENLFYLVNKFVSNTYVYYEFDEGSNTSDAYERKEIIFDPQECKKIEGSYDFCWGEGTDREDRKMEYPINREYPINIYEYKFWIYDELLRFKKKADDKGFIELSEAIENCFPVIIIDGQNLGKKHLIKNVVIPDSVKIIDDELFAGCSNLMSVTIPDSVTSIGGEAMCFVYELDKIYSYNRENVEYMENKLRMN